MHITDLKAPYLSDAHIERQAQLVLNAHEAKHGKIESFETPIEDILDTLGLSLEIDNFKRSKYFGEDGDKVLGFIEMRKKAVFVNQLLDPMENPQANIGRFNFTLAHEAGHFVLHSEFFHEFYQQADFFDDPEEPKPAILCRHPDDEPEKRRPFIEQHADKFAAALLLPGKKVTDAWQKHFGTSKPISHIELAVVSDPDSLFHDTGKAINEALSPLAKQFKVSKTAMRIRCETIGLLSENSQPVLL
jgi:Zn-dependent peptidase ImmA (M78 family)